MLRDAKLVCGATLHEAVRAASRVEADVGETGSIRLRKKLNASAPRSVIPNGFMQAVDY